MTEGLNSFGMKVDETLRKKILAGKKGNGTDCSHRLLSHPPVLLLSALKQKELLFVTMHEYSSLSQKNVWVQKEIS